jgi:hypothetical protein
MDCRYPPRSVKERTAARSRYGLRDLAETLRREIQPNGELWTRLRKDRDLLRAHRHMSATAKRHSRDRRALRVVRTERRKPWRLPRP